MATNLHTCAASVAFSDYDEPAYLGDEFLGPEFYVRNNCSGLTSAGTDGFRPQNLDNLCDVRAEKKDL